MLVLKNTIFVMVYLAVVAEQSKATTQSSNTVSAGDPGLNPPMVFMMVPLIYGQSLVKTI